MKFRRGCAYGKFFLPLIFIFFNESISAQKKWDGEAGDGIWENPLNWFDNMMPTSLDDVILDNSILTTSYQVSISGSLGSANCRWLRISPNGLNTISLVIPSTNIQPIALTTAAPGYSIELNAGSVLINASGASSGTILSISDSMKILNNGKYIHRTPRGNATILNSLSSSPGTERGIIEFDVPVVTGSYIVSMTNRIFGTLVFSSVANNAPLTYISNGSNPVTIRGDLLLNPQVSLSVGFNDTIRIRGNMVHKGNIFNLSNNGNPTVLQLEGDVITNPGSMLTETNIAQPAILFTGNRNQEVSIQGNIINDVIFKLRKIGILTLTSPLSLPFTLELKRGVLKTDNINLLTLGINSTIIVDSSLLDSSFIDGPVRKLGLVSRDHFLFPVGKANKMRWLELKEVSGDFTIEFFQANPYNLSSTMSGIDHVSSIEYWTVESPGPASGKVELSFDNVNSGGVTDMTSLRVAQLIGSWANRGNTATTGSAGSAGSVTSNLISSFDINSRNFTLGSMVPNENPLPVKWLRLSVTRGQHQLEFRWTIPPNWQLREFILEGSNDGSHFNTLTKKDFDERFQTYNQLTPDDEERYMLFRIKAIERDGGIFFSNQVGVPGRDYISWRAHPVTSTELCIWILASKPTSLNVVLVNNYGQVLLKRKINVLAGSQQILIGIPNLNPGSYQLIGFNEVLRAKVIRFMKK